MLSYENRPAFLVTNLELTTSYAIITKLCLGGAARFLLLRMVILMAIFGTDCVRFCI